MRSRYTTTTEAIIDKVAELIKAGKIREISDMRDETDLSGLKLDHRPQARRRAGQAHAEALPLNAAAGQLCLQLQHSHRGHAARDGRAARSSRSGRPGARSASAAACSSRSARRAKSSTCSRACARSCWTSTRPSASSARRSREAEVVPNLMIGFGIDEVQAEYRGRDQAAQHQQGIHSASRTAGDRRAGTPRLPSWKRRSAAKSASAASSCRSWTPSPQNTARIAAPSSWRTRRSSTRSRRRRRPIIP